MLGVSIYYVDGRRSFYDHVTGIDWNNVNIGLQFTSDFKHTSYKEIAASTIAEMRVKVYE